MEQRDILIAIQTDSQFNSVAPLIKLLKARNYSVDILVTPADKDNVIFNGEIDRVHKLLEDSGYDYITNTSNNHYRILLTAYLLDDTVSRDYTIGYMYGVASIRADTFTPERRGFLDGIFVHSIREANIARAYCESFIVPALQYLSLKKGRTEKKKRKTVLFLPTTSAYGTSDLSDSEIEYALDRLSAEYDIVTKPHPSMATNPAEQDKMKILSKYSKELIEPDVSIVSLLDKADIMLTDYSSSFASELYCNVPIAVFYPRLEPVTHRYAGIKSWLVELIEAGVIPCAKSPDDIVQTVNDALGESIVKLQRETSDKYFTARNEGADAWVDIIDTYLSDKHSPEYLAMKRYYFNRFKEVLEEKALAREAPEVGVKGATKQLVTAVRRKIGRILHV